MIKFRTFVLVLLLSAIHMTIFSDIFVDGIDISNSPHIKYCELVWKKEKVNVISNIIVKFGKDSSFLSGSGFLSEKNGTSLKFRNVQELLHHVTARGWKNLKSFISCTSGNAFYHFHFIK